MNKGPLVSVIISAYNVEKYIEAAIRSILDQDYANLEIVIADDGSTDRTKIIIDSLTDTRIKRHHNSENIGLLHTWNKLLPLTEGAYITFQDGDDISLPKRISKLVSFLESNPEVGLCGTNFIRYFDRWGLYQESNYPLSDSDIRTEFKKEIVPFNGTRIMVRRKVYELVGGFREFFKGLAAEDFDWILRAADHFQVANIPDVLYEYRYFHRSASKNALDSSVERIFVNKIIFFLAQQRQQFWVDAIESKRPDQIDDFLTPYRAALEADTSNYLRYNRVFSNALSNKDFSNAKELFFGRLKNHPTLVVNNLKDFYRLVFSFIRTLIKSLLFRINGRARYNSLSN